MICIFDGGGVGIPSEIPLVAGVKKAGVAAVVLVNGVVCDPCDGGEEIGVLPSGVSFLSGEVSVVSGIESFVGSAEGEDRYSFTFASSFLASWSFIFMSMDKIY